MSLRKAYAATLQWLRVRRGLSQAELQTQTDQGHISRLEASTTSASVDLSADLARALGLTPLSFFALITAASEGKTARAALMDALAELELVGVLDEELPGEPQKLTPPRKITAEEKLKAIRELREAGITNKHRWATLAHRWLTLRSPPATWFCLEIPMLRLVTWETGRWLRCWSKHGADDTDPSAPAVLGVCA